MRFSCLMPTKDRPDFIRSAIDSILRQDHPDFEIIVNDGGESIEHLLPADPRIHYLRANTGIANALNNAMRVATGNIFVQTNDDDQLIPGVLTFIDQFIGDAQWVYGRVLRGDAAYSRQCELEELLHVGNILAQPGVFWTRKAYQTVGDFDESVDLACDYDYWIRLWKEFEPKYTDNILAIYTEHPGMATHTRSGEQCDAGNRVKLKHAKK